MARTPKEIVESRRKDEGWFDDSRGEGRIFSTRAHAYGSRDKPGREDIENADELMAELVKEGYLVFPSICDEFVMIEVGKRNGTEC